MILQLPGFQSERVRKRRDWHSWIKLTQNFVLALKSQCVHAHTTSEEGEEGRNVGMRGWGMAPQLPTVHCDCTQCGAFYTVVL